MKAYGLAAVTTHPSGITYGKLNTRHLKLIHQAVNFSAKEPVVTAITVPLATVRVAVSTWSTAS